jgi:hypothetical protein
MTVPGRRLPFAGIAKGFDCVTATKGWSPKSAIHISCSERPLTDRKADIAYEEIIVRCSNRFDCALSPCQKRIYDWCVPQVQSE